MVSLRNPPVYFDKELRTDPLYILTKNYHFRSANFVVHSLSLFLSSQRRAKYAISLPKHTVSLAPIKATTAHTNDRAINYPQEGRSNDRPSRSVHTIS